MINALGYFHMKSVRRIKEATANTLNIDNYLGLGQRCSLGRRFEEHGDVRKVLEGILDKHYLIPIVCS